MARKQYFSWYANIVDIVDEGTLYEKDVISDVKLKQMIDDCGVDTVSPDGDRITDHLGRMNNHQIDIVMSYKPNFIFRNAFNFDRFGSGFNCYCYVYILQKIIENDDDFRYTKCIILCGGFQYDNLECFVRIYYRSIVSIFKDPSITLAMYDVPHVDKHDVQKYILLSNHVKKWFSLFDMMKRYLIEKGQF